MSQYVNKIRTDRGDLPVNYEALANLPTISNPNLLINSDFRNPVNQRGATKYVGSTERVYTIDRWCFDARNAGRTMEIVSGGILITNSETAYSASFKQQFEQTLPSGDYTLSVKVAAKTGKVFVRCDANGSEVKTELQLGVNTLTVTSATISSFSFLFYESSSVKVEWAKLEVGTKATPFSPRPYAEEIMMCKRYYQRYRDEDDTCIICTQNYTTTTITNGRVNLQVEMRAKPTVTVYSMEVKDINNGTAVTITSTEGKSISKNMVEFTAQHNSMTVSPRYIYARFAADAEIY